MSSTHSFKIGVMFFLAFTTQLALAENSMRYMEGSKWILTSPVSIEREADLKVAFDYLVALRLSDSTPLHKEFFGNNTEENVYSTFLNLIDFIDYKETDEPSLLAYARFGVPIMTITNNFPKMAQDPARLIDVVSAIIHEAHHISNQNGLEGHVRCPLKDLYGETIIGYLSGQPLKDFEGCDDRYDGAYGAQIVMLYNIAQFCTNCSDAEKSHALLMSQNLMRRIVDRKAFTKIENDFLAATGR